MKNPLVNEKKNGVFDYEDFQRVLLTYGALYNRIKHDPKCELPPDQVDPVNPLSEATVLLYKSALRRQWEEQKTKRSGETSWDQHLDTPRVKRLIKIAKVSTTCHTSSLST